jgi:alanyl-tRNA synthetase
MTRKNMQNGIGLNEKGQDFLSDISVWLGEKAFFFYDTYGIPPEIFQEWVDKNKTLVLTKYYQEKNGNRKRFAEESN